MNKANKRAVSSTPLWRSLAPPLLSAAGLLIGTTATAQTTAPQLLHSFGYSDGAYPIGGLVQGGNGLFYGTTTIGGPSSYGSVFSMSADGSLTTLYSFVGADGGLPATTLLPAGDGSFYGTTGTGGAYGYGTVFNVTASGALTNLHDFNGTDGGDPAGALILGSDGKLYGTTSAGGLYGYGSVYSMSTDGSGFTSLHVFNGADGADPYAGLVRASDGYFYGTTVANTVGPSAGTIFKIAADGSFTSLLTFNGNDGSSPYGGLVQGNDGRLYGTTSAGGASGGAGSIYALGLDGSLVTLASFDGGTDGGFPRTSLVLGSDGNFYGTTYYTAYGQVDSYGTVFGMTPGGSLRTLATFDSTHGAYPESTLVEGSDGNFYGSTYQGGANNEGTLYRVPPMLPLPPAPTNLSAVAGVAQIALSWTAAAGADSYNLYEFNNPTPFKTGITGTNLSVTGLVQGEQYSFTVAAVDGDLVSAYSNVATATPLYGALPPPVFQPARDTSFKPHPVTIADARAGSTIYYTTDGSTPTTASPKYSGPITVSSSETIKAYATAPAYVDSSVSSISYTILQRP